MDQVDKLILSQQVISKEPLTQCSNISSVFVSLQKLNRNQKAHERFLKLEKMRLERLDYLD